MVIASGDAAAVIAGTPFNTRLHNIVETYVNKIDSFRVRVAYVYFCPTPVTTLVLCIFYFFSFVVSCWLALTDTLLQKEASQKWKVKFMWSYFVQHCRCRSSFSFHFCWLRGDFCRTTRLRVRHVQIHFVVFVSFSRKPSTFTLFQRQLCNAQKQILLFRTLRTNMCLSFGIAMTRFSTIWESIRIRIQLPICCYLMSWNNQLTAAVVI